jgi:hypothetical protein
MLVSKLGKTRMRAVIFILIIAVLLIVAAIATGFLDIRQIRGGRAPQVAATRNGVSTKGGRAPAFDVETGSVKVGTKETAVKTPTLEIQKAGQNQAATNNAH